MIPSNATAIHGQESERAVLSPSEFGGWHHFPFATEIHVRFLLPDTTEMAVNVLLQVC